MLKLEYVRFSRNWNDSSVQIVFVVCPVSIAPCRHAAEIDCSETLSWSLVQYQSRHRFHIGVVRLREDAAVVRMSTICSLNASGPKACSAMLAEIGMRHILCP